MAEGNFQFINEEIKKLKESEESKQAPESYVFQKTWCTRSFEIQKRFVVGIIVSVVLLVLFVVLLATTLTNSSNNPEVHTQDGYKIDASANDYGVYGQKIDLQVSTLARDGLRTGPGYTVKFGQVLDGMQRDVCAYPPKTIYSSWGVVQVDQNASAWSPQSQSQLFLPGDDSVLVPLTANPQQVLEISRSPDFNSLMQFNNKLYMGVHHEAPRPSEVSFLEIAQGDDGKFSVVATRRVDFSAYNGTWNSCAGSMTPWGTHLGSQEYEPDARILVECDTFDCMADRKEQDTQNIQDFMRYYGFYNNDTLCYVDQKQLTVEDVKQNFNPYMYGHIPEIGVDDEGNPTVKLWFTLGRFSHEAALILPDNQTVYLTDDGTNTGFYKFVADQPNDLSSGCIFGAKALQNNDDNSFQLSWIQLGCGSNDEIELLVRNGIQFGDIFNFAQANDNDDGTICPQGFTSTNVGHDHRLECLQLKPQQEKAAAFLETRRMLALMGGTTEFSKMEGITYDGVRNRLYVGVSEVRYGMEDNMKKGEAKKKYDIGGPNHIKLTYNPCGCVYASDLDDIYNATSLFPLICGQLENPLDPEQGCKLNQIAGPDNIVMAGPGGLLISEDTDMHVNNFLWLYDLNTTVLTRIASCMYGSEVTGPYYHENVKGSSYIFFVCQHPYEESNRDKVMEPEATGLAGWLNYLGPLPVLGEDEVISCNNLEAPSGVARHQVQATRTCYIGKRVKL